LVAILFVPAAIVAYFTGQTKWLVIIPAVIVLVALFIAALPIKRKVTPQQYAMELEAHMLGTDGAWGWDDSTSIAIADPKLDALRVKLHKFDLLPTEERRKEFEGIIDALKRGEIPKVNDVR
jgi:hypothetical protein